MGGSGTAQVTGGSDYRSIYCRGCWGTNPVQTGAVLPPTVFSRGHVARASSRLRDLSQPHSGPLDPAPTSLQVRRVPSATTCSADLRRKVTL